MVATDLSIAERISAGLQRIKENDAVALRLIYDGQVRVIRGLLKSKQGVPAMITSSGTLLFIRPIIRIDDTPFEFLSIARDDARWN